MSISKTDSTIDTTLSKTASPGDTSVASASLSYPLSVLFLDPLGDPIPDIGYVIKSANRSHQGKSSADGMSDALLIAPNSLFTVWVIKDDGGEKKIFAGTMPHGPLMLNARSPRLVFPMESATHEGEPGQESMNGTKHETSAITAPEGTPPIATSTGVEPKTNAPGVATGNVGNASTAKSPPGPTSGPSSNCPANTETTEALPAGTQQGGSITSQNPQPTSPTPPTESSANVAAVAGSAAPAEPSATPTPPPAAPPSKPKATQQRDGQGHPITRVQDKPAGLSTYQNEFKKAMKWMLRLNPATLGPTTIYEAYDWWRARKAHPKATNGNIDQPADLMRLWQMLHFAKTQCGWQWNSKTVKTKVLTTKIVKKNGKTEKAKEWKDADQYLCSGTVYLHLLERRGDFIVAPDQQISLPDFTTAKPITQPKGKCYAYVKVALALGEFTTAEGKHWNDLELHRILGGIPAKDAQVELPRDGWVNVTDELLGDPLLAAPGDVIVYDGFSRTVDRDLKNRTVKVTDINVNNQYGHIEIRSYDGFLSDYWKARPVGKSYRILGVWRKNGYSDLWPLYRIKAFLRILAARETGGLPASQRAFALNTPIDGKLYFSDVSKHPWTGKSDKIPKGHSTASGQYQITWETALDALIRGYGVIPNDFTVATQVRIVTHKLLYSSIGNIGLDDENCRTCLSLIREGGESQIIQAVRILANGAWTSLPRDENTPHPNGNYSMNNLINEFERFTHEEAAKGAIRWVD